MSRPGPAAALNGVQTGHICDRCTRRIDHGEGAGMYVTWYDGGGWTPRRTWCRECSPDRVDPGTDGADEAILHGVLFAHRFVSATVVDRNHPMEQ